jgi:hypothetical protein
MLSKTSRPHILLKDKSRFLYQTFISSKICIYYPRTYEIRICMRLEFVDNIHKLQILSKLISQWYCITFSYLYYLSVGNTSCQITWHKTIAGKFVPCNKPKSNVAQSKYDFYVIFLYCLQSKKNNAQNSDY